MYMYARSYVNLYECFFFFMYVYECDSPQTRIHDVTKGAPSGLPSGNFPNGRAERDVESGPNLHCCRQGCHLIFIKFCHIS